MLRSFGACIGLGLAHIPSSTMPFQIGALIDGSHRSSSEAGLFGFVQIGSLALSMIAIARVLDRASPRPIAFIGCLLAALANCALYFLPEFGWQLALGAASGLGYGLVFAATVAGVAHTNDPDRLYAIGNGGALLIIVGLIAALPSMSQRFGGLGVFVSLAIVATVCTPLSLVFDRGARHDSDRQSRRVAGAPGLLFAWTAYSTGSGAVYAFSERIGVTVNLDRADIGMVLSLGVFVGVLGTIIAALSAKQASRRWALLVGMTGTGFSSLLLGLASNLPLYAAGVFLYWIFNMFLYSYLLGTAAALDPEGKVGTLGGGLERLGYASGAAFGGVIAEHLSYAATGVVGFAGCLLGAAVGFPSLFRALSRRSADSAWGLS